MAREAQGWITFAGIVLVVAVLYWAQAIVVPIALAGLITFVLSPAVTLLQRWLGRVLAVLVVVALMFSGLGVATWFAARQVAGLAAELPRYRENIREKINDVRRAGRNGSVEEVQKTLEEIEAQLTQPDEGARRNAPSRPAVVQVLPVSRPLSFPAWLGPVIGPLSTAGLVVALVIFMLLEREDLRARVLGLIGHGHLAVTTKAFDEASSRVSRQLLMQTLVNGLYGGAMGIGLWWIGVPYPLLWAALGAALRFVPYLGPIVAAAGPILVSLAALPGWIQPLWVVGLFIVLELFTNLVLETVLYAGAAGVSQVALLVAVAGWTWLWGPTGLLLATPLTICLVVLGKHISGLEFLSTLMADAPALAPDGSYYQRLLAEDTGEAVDLIERHLSGNLPPDTVFDSLMLPALVYAERDRLEGRLTDDEERTVLEATRELLSDAASALRAARAQAEPEGERDASALQEPSLEPLVVHAYPAGGTGDELALRMLGLLLEDASIAFNVQPARLLVSELVAAVRESPVRVLCVADLPPSSPSKTRYVLRKLRAALPEATILVGRWAPPLFKDDERAALLDAGATHVTTSLVDARDILRRLAAERPRDQRTGSASGRPERAA